MKRGVLKGQVRKSQQTMMLKRACIIIIRVEFAVAFRQGDFRLGLVADDEMDGCEGDVIARQRDLGKDAGEEDEGEAGQDSGEGGGRTKRAPVAAGNGRKWAADEASSPSAAGSDRSRPRQRRPPPLQQSVLRIVERGYDSALADVTFPFWRDLFSASQFLPPFPRRICAF